MTSFGVFKKARKDVPEKAAAENDGFISEKPMDIYFSIKPVYFLSKLLGAAPLERSDSGSFEFSKPSALYSVFLATSMTFVLLRYSEVMIMDMTLHLFKFVTYLQLLNLVVPSTFHRLMSIVNCRKLSVVLSRLNDIDRRLGLKEECHIKAFRYSLLLVAVTTVLVMTYGCCRIFLSKETEAFKGYISIFMSIAAFSGVLTFHIIECQFVGLVLLIRHRFAVLNELVSGLKLDVTSIRKIHDQLSDLCEEVNGCYSPQILANVTLNFISLTYSCYFCCLNILSQDRGIYSGTFWDLLTLYGLIIVAYSLLLKLAACHSTAVEGNRTDDLLHKQYDQMTDTHIKLEVQMFSLQQLHKRVKFSVCGIFPLDFSLLCSIVGAVTTYLVILIQFQLTMPSQNNVYSMNNDVMSTIDSNIY